MISIEWLVAFTDKTWELMDGGTYIEDMETSHLEALALEDAAERFPNKEIALVAVHHTNYDEDMEEIEEEIMS